MTEKMEFAFDVQKIAIFMLMITVNPLTRVAGLIVGNTTATSCEGSNVNINFLVDPQTGTVPSGSEIWYHESTIIATKPAGVFSPQGNYASRLSNYSIYGLTLDNVTAADEGRYLLLFSYYSPTPQGTKTATATLTVNVTPTDSCIPSYRQSGNLVVCELDPAANCGSPRLEPMWTNTSGSTFNVTKTGTYTCCAIGSILMDCYRGNNSFCKTFQVAVKTTSAPGGNNTDKSVLGQAIGTGLGNDAICIFCLGCIVCLVKIVGIEAEEELQKPKPEGSDVTITAPVRGFRKSSVKWTGPHGEIKDIKGKYDKIYNRKTGLSTLKVSNLEINDSGLYTCHSKSSCGSLAEDSVRILVYEQFAVHIDTGETFRQHGSDVEIICHVYGDVDKNVNWTGSKENILTNGGRYTIAPYDSSTNKSSLTIRTSSMNKAEEYICQVAFKDSGVACKDSGVAFKDSGVACKDSGVEFKGVSVKIYIKMTELKNGSLRVIIEKIVLFVPASENESREWIGLQGKILTNTEKYNIKSCDSNTNGSHLTINEFSVNDNGCYTCQPKNSSGSKNSIAVSINDATDYKKSASQLILGLCFSIICVSCIACIVILVMIGEQSALKFGLGLGLGLGIPFIGCIIVIVILFKKVLNPQTQPPEGQVKRGSRSDVSRRDVHIQMEEKHVRNNEERPPASRIRTQNRVESEPANKKTSDRPQPLPPVGVVTEDRSKHRPQPPPPDNSDVKDPSKRGLSANFDDKQGLPTGTPRPNRLAPLTQKQAHVEEEDASKEKPKKKRKNRKNKGQMNEGNPEDEMVELTSKRTLPEMPEDQSDGN